MAREELFALKVWVEEPTGWEVRGMMPVAGPFVSDERVVPLDVSRVAGDVVRVRLQPPAGFWALNSFAVDYTAERPLRVTKVAAGSARDEQGRDLTGLLRERDGAYFEMHRKGEQAQVSFAVPAAPAGSRGRCFCTAAGTIT